MTSSMPSKGTPATLFPRSGGFAGSAMQPLRSLVARLMKRLHVGAMTVELPDGSRIEGRGMLAGPHVTVVLHRWRPLLRLVLQGDIGFARSYRDADWSTPDLTALLLLALRNESHWMAAIRGSKAMRGIDRLRHLMRRNTRRGSRENISFHYDLGNEFYAQWLDPELIYSSALWRSGAESLEEAQANKLARIVELLDLPADASVLEIGCGWGALAIALARDRRAHVTGLTLSTEQLAHARLRATKDGVKSLLDLRLRDYRDVRGTYDRIVSIEMLEAVGERFWPGYFDTLRQRLKPGGLAVLQVITIDDTQFQHYRESADFIQRLIFPGGMLPSWGALQAQAWRAGLAIERVQSFGESYATTLVHWRQRFMRAWPAIEAMGFDARFRRLWEYYLCYCEAGFRAGRVDVGLFTLRHCDPE
ncbi:MAG: class I SAM-dependent methyltransferase [Variovorax sp.]|nr:class I SAM-dependent methyltransferase [Variovorax sp.]